MIDGYHAVVQTLLGTLLTWGLTAAGAALVFVFDGKQVYMANILYFCLLFNVNVCIINYFVAIAFHEVFIFVLAFIEESVGWKPGICCGGKSY